MEYYLDTRQAASLLGVAEVTLKVWRGRGFGPPYTKLLGRVRYSREDVLAWLASRRVLA